MSTIRNSYSAVVGELVGAAEYKPIRLRHGTLRTMLSPSGEISRLSKVLKNELASLFRAYGYGVKFENEWFEATYNKEYEPLSFTVGEVKKDVPGFVWMSGLTYLKSLTFETDYFGPVSLSNIPDATIRVVYLNDPSL